MTHSSRDGCPHSHEGGGRARKCVIGGAGGRENVSSARRIIRHGILCLVAVAVEVPGVRQIIRHGWICLFVGVLLIRHGMIRLNLVAVEIPVAQRIIRHGVLCLFHDSGVSGSM